MSKLPVNLPGFERMSGNEDLHVGFGNALVQAACFGHMSESETL